MMYGFIVAAWLVLWLVFTSGNSVPFPSMEACESARTQISQIKRDSYYRKKAICVPTNQTPSEK